MVLHVRADEACHRDVNHHLGDKYKNGDLDSAPTFMSRDERAEPLLSHDRFPEEFNGNSSSKMRHG